MCMPHAFEHIAPSLAHQLCLHLSACFMPGADMTTYIKTCILQNNLQAASVISTLQVTNTEHREAK